jgi:hypothetical protein
MCETFFILRRTQRDTIKKCVYWSSCVVPLCLSDFNSLIFPDIFSKNVQISNFIQVGPVEAELLYSDMRADGQTDRGDEANSYFSQFR